MTPTLRARAEQWLGKDTDEKRLNGFEGPTLIIRDLLTALTEVEDSREVMRADFERRFQVRQEMLEDVQVAAAAYRRALEEIVGRAGDTVLPSVPYSREDCQEIARKALRALDSSQPNSEKLRCDSALDGSWDSTGRDEEQTRGILAVAKALAEAGRLNGEGGE